MYLDPFDISDDHAWRGTELAQQCADDNSDLKSVRRVEGGHPLVCAQ